METAVVVMSLVAVSVIGFVASFHGLNLRKCSSWLYGALSFLCGFAIGTVLGDFVAGLEIGILFAFLMLLIGAVMRWHKLRYMGRAESMLLKYGKDDDPSLFAKLVRKLLGKYK